MDFLSQFIPRYLLTKRNQIILVTSAAAFALFFIIVYQPFGVLQWGRERVSEFMFVIYSLLIVLLGMSIVAISRVIMYYRTKKHEISILNYAIWVFVELAIMAIAYTICSILADVQEDIWVAFKSALQNTSLILLIPYIICITAFTLQDKNERLRQIEDDFDKAVAQKMASKGLISFYDERGELQLSVTKDNLLYIESADNYIYIWYMKNNLPKKLMLRNTLKRTAESLAETNVMRCHRGYMVNMEQVKVLRREKENFYLELGIEGVKDIPVSKTYGDAVMKWLSM
ncbi:MAG: LytTR family transcriptional regulator [Bacteroidaceae bacterium]|nr:LytTR family transcriptional regulator [Bacteroidaceae bacterium]